MTARRTDSRIDRRSDARGRRTAPRYVEPAGDEATEETAWRLANLADIPGLHQLTARSIDRLRSDYADEAIDELIEDRYGVDPELIQDGTCFLVEIAGEIAGVGAWSFRRSVATYRDARSEADDRLDPRREAARIRGFFVDPARQRSGVGALLLGLGEAAARDAGFAKAELAATLASVPFYARHGYISIRTMHATLPSGLPFELEVMEKRLVTD